MAYSNSQILSAVLGKFLQPIVQMYGGEKLASLPWVRMLETKVKSMGIVSGSWSLIGELSPIVERVSGKLITPILNGWLSKLDDTSLPAMAHNVVDAALENGKLSLLDGMIEFEKSDLQELKRLLNINLPLGVVDEYIVKEDVAESETIKNEEV